MRFREHFTWEKIKATVKKVLMLLFNPRLLLCLLIGWMITNGWSYLLLGLGLLFDITWMQIVASAYISLLWFPFTPEKLITVAIAIFLLRLLFPKDEKTLGVLTEMYHNAKETHRQHKKEKIAKKQSKKKATQNSENTEQ